jgi:hypothetical protein
MRTEDLDEMRGLALFRHVDPARVETMLRVAFLQRFPAQLELVRELSLIHI